MGSKCKRPDMSYLFSATLVMTQEKKIMFDDSQTQENLNDNGTKGQILNIGPNSFLSWLDF